MTMSAARMSALLIASWFAQLSAKTILDSSKTKERPQRKTSTPLRLPTEGPMHPQPVSVDGAPFRYGRSIRALASSVLSVVEEVLRGGIQQPLYRIRHSCVLHVP